MNIVSQMTKLRPMWNRNNFKYEGKLRDWILPPGTGVPSKNRA